jgi:YidC/Oxa1 family membrane protein insertase
MDKRSYLAVALSLVIWMVWQKVYLEPIQLQQQQQQQAALIAAQNARAAKAKEESQVSGSGSALSALKSDSSAGQAPVQKGVLENGDSFVSVSNEPWALSGWELKSFSRSLDKQDGKINLGHATGFDSQMRLRFSDPALSVQAARVWNKAEQTSPRQFTSLLKTEALEASRVVTLDQSGYGAQLEYKVRFLKDAPKFVFLDLFGSPKRETDKEGSIFGQAPDKVKVTYLDAGGRHSQIGAKLKDDQESASGVRWLGFDTRYFVLAVVPGMPGQDFGAQVAHDDLGSPAVRGSVVLPTEGKKEISFSTKVYFGPKNLETLRQVDPVLKDAIDFGWTSFIAIPLLQALKWLYSYVRNYGLAIIALTFLIKMLLFPLMYKSMKSMAKMSKLQPQLNALREKYKDDKEKLNLEMMNFMKQNGYNPVGGCLPILVQMPIFFALYRVLFNSMELYQAPFAFWIHDLSSPDPFFVTPVLLTGLMYLQQKLSPNTAADPAQQKMMQIMPVMFGAFMLMLPSGLTIYMVVNSATSICQQWILNHKLGLRSRETLVAKA